MPKEITRADIMDLADYTEIRKQKRAALVAEKKLRRVELGPHATFYFENYQTMWLQIHEMLYIEKGGEEQIADELAAYNPLIPQGDELVATLMFEIDDEHRRKALLSKLGGVEETVFIQIGDIKVIAQAEQDVDRTSAEGKASSVQFLHFPFTAAAKQAFAAGEERVILGIEHENYPHMAVMVPKICAALAKDFA